MTDQDKPLIVALDYADAGAALALADQLDPAQCRVKVGKELFTRAGPEVVRKLVTRGFAVFLDLKFHDIPNTVAGACRAAADLGVWMMNVHAAGGEAMMRAARTALGDDAQRPLLIAVTVLTSFDEPTLHGVGVAGTIAAQVSRLAALTEAAGLDGVVCSPLEIAQLRAERGAAFKLVTPGVRPASSGVDDQVRVATPGAAIGAGASFLVVGRPVTQAPDPLAALAAINAEIAAARRHG
ncbi:MAG: orotidine-5'-phosphate decarboxylase [Proteobacteria bacterium]|jgi:orotidine-5'-phosphate decarboxylase|nr:orotidine-5'-phosphate decarboxylase [Pseudomonadota bacterium]